MKQQSEYLRCMNNYCDLFTHVALLDKAFLLRVTESVVCNFSLFLERWLGGCGIWQLPFSFKENWKTNLPNIGLIGLLGCLREVTCVASSPAPPAHCSQ